MSLLGKVLAGLNILGAVVFVVVALMDYSKREAWAYANFAHDVAYNGLPLDDKQTDDHDSPLKYKIAPETKADWFGTNPADQASTQVEAVDHVKAKLDALLNGAQGEQQTVKLAEVLGPFAQHDGEREWLLSVETYLSKPEDEQRLHKRLHDAFAPAVQACVAHPADVKFPQAFVEACRAEGPTPAPAFEQTFLRLLPAKPEKTFDAAVAEAQKVPANAANPAQEAHDRAEKFLQFLRDDPKATVRKAADAATKDTLDDVYAATLAAVHDQLKAQFDALLDDARNGPKAPGSGERLRDAQRVAIARLLFNTLPLFLAANEDQDLTRAQEFSRFVAVVGYREAVEEVYEQAALLQRVSEELQAARDLERGEFAAEHRRLADELRGRAAVLHGMTDELTRKGQEYDKLQGSVTAQQAKVDAAEKELADDRTRTEADMAKLRATSDSLHKLRIEGRDVLGENLNLEKKIRGLEDKH